MNTKSIFDKLLLILLAVSPMIIGFAFNMITRSADLPMVLNYLVAALFLIYWFWVGQMFAKRTKNSWFGILGGNIIIILSVLIYNWQMLMLVDETKRMVGLAALSQLALSPTIFLNARLGMSIGKLFYPNAMIVTDPIMLIIQFTGLILVMGFFVWGYLSAKHPRSALLQKK